jgi:hypothetical protein
MSTEERIAAIAERAELAERARREIDVPWDDLRAARVHKRALEGFRAAPSSTSAGPGQRRAWASWRRLAGAALAAVAVAAALLVWVRLSGDTPALAWTATSTVAYADGSLSRLSATAQLSVVEDEVERVEVSQRAGRVRYEIKPRPERRFVVGALGVTITVLGTVFDVSIEENRVEVVVERGRVRVEHGDRRLELGPGEHVTVIGGDAVTTAQKSAAHDEADGPTAVIDEESLQDAKAPGGAEAAAPASATSSAAPAAAPPSASEYLRRADAARADGRLDDAVAALQSLLRDHPRDARTTLALFTLGRVERQRARHADAARAFEQCGAALGGDAIAEAAASWQQAGQGAQARAAAQRYLQLFPAGVHAPRMRAMAGD